MPEADTRPIPSPSAIAAAAVFVAGYLFGLDLLLGGLTYGAHLGSPTTGPPLILVDAAGFVTYLLVILLSVIAVYAVVPRLTHGESGALWRTGFSAPLVAVSLLFVRFGVGDGDFRAGEVGGRLVTAVLIAAVLALIPFLGRLRKRAMSGPGATALLGLALPATVALTSVAVGSFLPDSGLRRARLIAIAVTVAWMGTAGLLAMAERKLSRSSARRRVWRWVAIMLVWGSPAAAWLWHERGHNSSSAGEGPSIIFVTFDAMRADRLSLYGGRVPAPNFAALAGEGVTFEQARSQAPHTVASITSMFSSLYPSQLPHGEREDNPARGRAIPAGYVTLAKALSGRGYATCAITANWTLGPHTGVLQGFSERVVIDHQWRRRNFFSQVLPGLDAAVQSVVRRPADACLMDSSEVVLRYAHDFITRHRQRPVFLWLHFMNPHDPYAPPERFRRGLLRGTGPWRVFAPHDSSIGTPTVAEIRSGIVFLDKPTRRYISDLYDCEVAHADDNLGRVRSMVREAAIPGPIIWCVGADHGQEFWDHGGYYHGHTLYDELLHVPLLVSAPGGRRGVRVTEPVPMLDIMPTLLALSGLPTPAPYEGRSLADAVLRGGPVSPRPVFADSNIYFEPAETVIADGYKLVRHRVSRTSELYNLTSDPRELHDLAQTLPHVAKHLAGVIDDWRARSRTFGAPLSPQSEDEMLTRLRALGYL
jgi:arylsulfatase